MPLSIPSPIQTSRLILRPFERGDLPYALAVLSDEQANRFLPWFPIRTLEEAQAHIQRQCGPPESPSLYYAVCRREDSLPIGYVHLSGDDSHDFGYGLRHEFWGKGIMTEACRPIVEVLKNSGLPFLTATYDRDNPRSGRVLEKLGMTYRYSYREQWQPKNLPVVFRMLQLDLLPGVPTYSRYREQYGAFTEEFK